ncbi:MAG: DUF2934 domain-containing protein [Betaproteobacteria bacterium]
MNAAKSSTSRKGAGNTQAPQQRPQDSQANVSSTFSTDPNERQARIAQRAYSHAQRRGFQGDGQLEDWLRAEREIDHESHSVGKKQVASMNNDSISADAIARETMYETPRDGGAEHIEPDQMKDWAQRLGVPANRLREVIQRVGSMVRDVRQSLEGGAQVSESAHANNDAVAGKTARATRKKKSTAVGAPREG